MSRGASLLLILVLLIVMQPASHSVELVNVNAISQKKVYMSLTEETPKINIGVSGNLTILSDVVNFINEKYGSYVNIVYLVPRDENSLRGIDLLILTEKVYEFQPQWVIGDYIEKRTLIIQMWDKEQNEWVNITEIVPRNHPYLYAIDLTNYTIKVNKTRNVFRNKGITIAYLNKLLHTMDSERRINITIRILFTRPHALGYIAIESTPIRKEIERWLDMKIVPSMLINAYHSNGNKVLKYLLLDNKTAMIAMDENVTMEFTAPRLNINSLKKDIIFVVRGYYLRLSINETQETTQTKFRAKGVHLNGKIYFVATKTHFKVSQGLLTVWVNITSESNITECELIYSYKVNNISKGPLSIPMGLEYSTLESDKYISVWSASITIPEVKNYKEFYLEVEMTAVFKDFDGETHSYHFKDTHSLSVTTTVTSQRVAWSYILIFMGVGLAPFAFVAVYYFKRRQKSDLYY